MHTLLGFIQFLLMLTETKLIPDISWVWNSEPVVKEAVVTATHAVHFQDHSDVHFYFSPAALCSDEEKSIPITRGTSFRNYVIRKQAWPQRQYVNSKLYLVFCQLKTEG